MLANDTGQSLHIYYHRTKGEVLYIAISTLTVRLISSIFIHIIYYFFLLFFFFVLKTRSETNH